MRRRITALRGVVEGISLFVAIGYRQPTGDSEDLKFLKKAETFTM
jgi:hypothetical protein